MAQKTTSSRRDFLLAAALVLGAAVLAAVSFWLPRHFPAPMTADIYGTVEAVQESYAGTRMSIFIAGNDSSYTLLLEEYEALPVKPEVGGYVDLEYDISAERPIRRLEVGDTRQDAQLVFSRENPLGDTLRTWQLAAFGAYGVYVLVCALIYRRKSTR